MGHVVKKRGGESWDDKTLFENEIRKGGGGGLNAFVSKLVAHWLWFQWTVVQISEGEKKFPLLFLRRFLVIAVYLDYSNWSIHKLIHHVWLSLIHKIYRAKNSIKQKQMSRKNGPKLIRKYFFSTKLTNA